MPEVLAIVPARGGSKGLPGKNVRPLLGHPLIAYSIEAGLRTPAISRVIVSTDSDEIAAVSAAYGAEVPFLRPSSISGDLSTDLEVFQHALHFLKETEDYVPDLVVQLRPTSPVRRVDHINDCLKQMVFHTEADSLRILTHAPITPYKMWMLDGLDVPIRPLLTLPGISEPYNMPRQSLPKIYWQIGYLDVIRPHVITEQNSMSGTHILPYLVESAFAVDIDDIESFTKAEQAILKNGGLSFNV